MNIRKFAYALAIVMLSYDVLSTFIAAKLYGRFADLSPFYNFLYQGNPVYIPITIVILISGLIFIFWVALLYVNNTELSVRILITLCDFAAVYLLIFEAIAVPHNTMVLSCEYPVACHRVAAAAVGIWTLIPCGLPQGSSFGSYGIVPSSEMFIIQEIASALIAGVVVVIVDWKRLLRRGL